MQPRLAALAGGFALGLAAAPLAAQDADTVIATVGDTEITIGHMIVARQTLPRQYQQLPDEVLFPGLLDQLIQQNALAQSLETPTKATQLTIENQRTGLLAGEALGMAGQDAVTDEAIEAAYAARYADAEPSTEYNAAHILVETEEEAQALIGRIDQGANFAELAREHSTGPSGPDGGALGWFGAGMMVPEFEEAVMALEAGEVSPPVQTQFGWHVVRLNETRMAEAPPLEEVRGEIAEELRQQAVEARIAEVVEQADITREEIDVDPSILSDLSLVAE
ncbi:MAG: peptidylprolyl isomerase [Paracoccaceae bacterium]|jgi:peptidyl-prolyl cis-trans isomerase C|nr:peptidylprolyl isomerase [Paracoccaceae bacterium]